MMEFNPRLVKVIDRFTKDRQTERGAIGSVTADRVRGAGNGTDPREPQQGQG